MGEHYGFGIVDEDGLSSAGAFTSLDEMTYWLTLRGEPIAENERIVGLDWRELSGADLATAQSIERATRRDHNNILPLDPVTRLVPEPEEVSRG